MPNWTIDVGSLLPAHQAVIVGDRNALPPKNVFARITPPEELGDSAIALFRSWLIERFGTRATAARPAVQLAVSNE